MKFKNEVYHIALSGILLGLALVVGFFAHFPLFGGNVYLVGAVVFVMPLALPFRYSFITATLAVILTDIYTGWAAYCWISFIAYGLATCVIWFFSKSKAKWVYIIGLLLGALVIVWSYFILEWLMFDKSIAINDAAATAIELAIALPITIALYYPIKAAIKVTRK